MLIDYIGQTRIKRNWSPSTQSVVRLTIRLKAYRPICNEGGCPFNSLYWHFLGRNRSVLSGNVLLKLVYANWDRQKPEQRQDILATAEWHLAGLDSL